VSHLCPVEKFDSKTVITLKLIMMNTLRNKVQLIGNLGNDPEIITLDGGKKLAKFSLATNEYYKDADGQKQTKTDWHNLVAWNKTAEIIENYVTKGKEIAIEGKLTNRSWDDKEGNKRYITEVVVSEVLMFSK
jgi:single-strand DNA-binding protein